MFQWFSKKLNQKRKGFTLIELVVVVAILGILAAIAIPRLGESRKNAEVKAQVANARTVASAVMMYQAANGGSTQPATDNISDLEPYINTGGLTGYKVNYVSTNPGAIYSITVSPGVNVDTSDDTPETTWYVGTDTLAD